MIEDKENKTKRDRSKILLVYHIIIYLLQCAIALLGLFAGSTRLELFAIFLVLAYKEVSKNLE